MKQSGFLKRIGAYQRISMDAMEQTMRQFMVDMFCLTLNDPEVMGKNVMGYNRLKKVVDAVIENYIAYGNAISTKNVDADYCRVKLDERLKKIIPDGEFHPFMERYGWLMEIKYGK